MKEFKIGFIAFLFVGIFANTGCGESTDHSLFFSDPTAADIAPKGLKNVPLRSWIRETHYKGKYLDLNYDRARKKMFGFVDNIDGLVTCIYTGFQEPARKATYLSYMDTEHTIPQKFFNYRGNMKSDLHHLFPTVREANGARSNYRFNEIKDASTRKWFGYEQDKPKIKYNIPKQRLEEFSEWDNINFEPRDGQKGNIARAIFYFYTMYPHVGTLKQVVEDVEILYLWHLYDPVDAQEMERNNRIEEVQGNRNPYIDSPELIEMAWGF